MTDVAEAGPIAVDDLVVGVPSAGATPLLPDGAPLPARPIYAVGTLRYTRPGLVRLFSWLLWGDFVWSLKDRSVQPVFQLILKHFHASDETVSLLMVSLPQTIALVLMPVVSYRSDRHRGRWGRRVPYL